MLPCTDNLPYIWHHYIDPAAFHYFHHSSNKGNFGSMWLPLDRWLGTEDPAWLQYLNDKRNATQAEEKTAAVKRSD